MLTLGFMRQHCGRHRLKIQSWSQQHRNSLMYLVQLKHLTASALTIHYTRYVPCAACFMALSIWKFPGASEWHWIVMRAFVSSCKHSSRVFTRGATSDSFAWLLY